MITKEQTKDFIARAYDNAVKHGFHDQSLSVGHCMMLVLSEVGEAVEADRKGLYFAQLYENARKAYGKSQDTTHLSKYLFEKYAKDSVEGELADVCIRLFDICGVFNVVPDYLSAGDMRDTFDTLCKDMSFCERCFMLSCLLCRCEDLDTNNLSSIIGGALTFISCMAEDMNVDLIRHIELKMEYNETRPKKHGKKY